MTERNRWTQIHKETNSNTNRCCGNNGPENSTLSPCGNSSPAQTPGGTIKPEGQQNKCQRTIKHSYRHLYDVTNNNKKRRLVFP